jgi:hypothetical protein
MEASIGIGGQSKPAKWSGNISPGLDLHHRLIVLCMSR